MARAKKESALTPDECLQAALVPDWEWPYKLPENWCWTYFKSMSTIQTGKKDANYGSDEGKYPFFTCAAEPIRCHGYSFDCRAILLAGNGDINNISRYNGKFEAYQRTYVVEIAEPLCFDYIFYWFKYRWFDFNKGKMFGTAIPYIRLGNLQEFPTPIPPLAEQQRIVDRIESLFAKLDEAKEKAQVEVDSFETRKAAILHKAFTGELTAKWREEHGVGMESWEQCSISDVCTVNPKKADTKDLPDELEVSFFPMPALSEIYGEITDPQTRLLKEVRSGFTNFSEGDVVFAKITPCMENGKSAVVGKLVNDIGYGTTEFFVLRCSDRLYNRFLYHLVRDKLFRDKAKAVMAGAVGQQRVPKRYLETYKLNLPKFNEQREIVRILDGSFAKEQQTKEAAEALLDQIDLMKKSILARAFRGELGTNDPNEESAVELLKQVIEQEDGDVIRSKAKAKRIAIPAEIKPLLSGANEEAIVKLLLKAAPQSVSTQAVMSISKKKFELMDALRNLEKKQIVSKSDSGEYSLVR